MAKFRKKPVVIEAVQVQSLGNQNKGTKSSYEGQEENK